MNDINKHNRFDNGDYLTSLILAEKDYQRQLIQRFERELNRMPEGSITRKKVNGTTYFYHILKPNGNMNTYIQKQIKKHQSSLVNQLIKKRFLQKSLKLLLSNEIAFSSFIRDYHPYFASYITDRMDYTMEYDNNCFFNKSALIENWIKEPYESNGAYPENLIHTTAKGLRVRSKSEALIAGVLEMKDIPFRYEAKITIDDQEYFPDFTIMKPNDGRIIYWEHYGKINDPAYLYTMTQKQIAYIRNGILPWENLIMTYDSEIGSINMMTINNIIKAVLLV